MKTVAKSLVLGTLLAFTSSFSFGNAVEPKASLEAITVVSTHYQNLFVFKVGRAFKGASVDIFYSNGELVATKQLAKRKMVINFCDVKSGTYTIRVTKDNRVQEFQYLRK